MENFSPNQMPPIQNNLNKKSIGPLVAVIIILAIIIIGGLYFLKERANQKIYVPDKTDVITESLSNQSNSDELSSIEKDLKATDLDKIDQGAASVEAELK